LFFHHHRRYLLVGWFWFLGTLVPMIGIITVGEQSMADRFAYIPCIGLLIAVVWTLNDWISEARTELARPHISRTAIGVAALCVTFALGCLTYRQLGYWRDDETLWRYTLSVTERNYMAHDNLALALAKQGRSDEAVAEFRAAKALHKYPPAQVLELAWYEQRVGHPEDAIEECNSILHDPRSSDIQLQAATWTELGQSNLQLHRYDQAAESYRNALQLSPENEMALVGSAILALRQDQPDDAVTQLAHAAKIDPSPVNFLLLAQSLRQAGRSAEADKAAAEARRISPDLSQPQIAAAQLLSVGGVMPQ
jgi:protein O-mannosyl-transferase